MQAINFGDGTVALAPEDHAVLAVPPLAAAQLRPELKVPAESSPIVNAHFLVARASSKCRDMNSDLPILGLVGGTSQWLFLRGSVASITVSAARSLASESSEAIASLLWREVAAALDLADAPVPAHRIIKEKRATFAQTPAALSRRPSPRTTWRNLFMAGDWTDTGLPATIESAVRSGRAAAACLLTGEV